MRRKGLIVLLALGTIAGYASGFASLRHCRAQRGEWGEHRWGRHHEMSERFERRVSRACAEAAREELDK